MKHLTQHLAQLALLAVTVLGGVAAAAAADVRACDFTVKARCASGSARITFVGGTLKRVEVDVDWCGAKGAPGYTCSIDASRGDKDSQWSDANGATTIANLAPYDATHPDSMKVTTGRTVSIDLANMQSLGHCGAGAELPRAIVIPEKKGACRVRLGE
jgi:hypothetical protein